VGDFNVDGLADFVALRNGFSAVVRLGSGDRAFHEAPDLESDIRSFAVVVGDFNGDARPDFAMSLFGNQLSLFLGQGNGSFVPAGSRPHTGNRPLSLAVADLNGDGTSDLAALASPSLFSVPVDVWLHFGGKDGLHGASRMSTGQGVPEVRIRSWTRASGAGGRRTV